jgi:Flp pilus assembly protein TadD
MGSSKKRSEKKANGTAIQEGTFEKFFLRGWRPYACMVLICFLIYFKTLFAGFVRLDDSYLILDNYSFISNLTNLPRLFVDDVFHGTSGDSFYRPLMALSLMIDSQFGKNRPFTYHLTNIIIHLIACCLLFLFLVRMKYKRSLAFLFTLLFVVHPLSTQAVAWIPGRNDTLLAVSALPAFIFFVEFIERRQWKHYAWHLIFFASALFTKETGIILIPLCLLYLALIAKERLFSFQPKILGFGWTGVLIFWAWLRYVALGGHGGAEVLNLGRSILVNGPAVIQVIGKIFLPFNLAILPTVQDTGFQYGIIVIIVLTAALFLFKKIRYSYAIFGFCWFLFFLLPTFIPTFVIPGSIIPILLEHRNYLPMIGFIFILMEMDWIKDSHLQKARSFIPFILVLFMFSGITFLHTDDFRDKIVFSKAAVETSPHSPIAHMNLGSAYQIDGELDQAEIEFKKTLELNPRQAMAYSNLAGIYLEKDLFGKAQEYIQRALEMDPTYAESHYNLGKLYYKQNRLEESESALQKTIRMDPKHFAAHVALGIIYMKRDMFNDAERELKIALTLNPFYENTLFNLGLVYSKQGRLKEAETLWLKTLEINKNHLDACLNLATYYYNQKDFGTAKRYFSKLRSKGVRIDPRILEQLDVR